MVRPHSRRCRNAGSGFLLSWARLTCEPKAQRPSYADYVESLNYRQLARRGAEVRLQQQVEDPLRPLPVLPLRVLQLGIDDLERARERDVDAAGDLRQPGF